MIEIKDSEQFFHLQNKFEYVPFSQSLGWFNYVNSQGREIRFFTDKEKNPEILFWGTIYRIPYLNSRILKIEGETYSTSAEEKQFQSGYAKLIGDYDGIEINSNNFYNVEYEVGIRRSGFKRPIGTFSSPLTIKVNFNQEPNYNRNWRRNAKKANKADLSFNELIHITDVYVDQFISMFDEMADLKCLGYKLNRNSLQSLMQSEDIRTFIVWDANDKPIAARIIHNYRQYASDVLAANSMEARNCGATYFIMQSIFEKLRSEKKLFFDFGRIPPSDHDSDSVYLFKNASRGNKIQYNGEWTYYRDRKTEVAMFLYKWLKLKKQRY